MSNRRYLLQPTILISTLFCGVSAFAQDVYGPPPGYRPEYPEHQYEHHEHHEYHERHVVRALYGARGRYADVTGIVRRFAHDEIRFEVSNETFGVDPYRGKHKHLRVIMVDHDGAEFERSWDEGDSVRL